MLTYSSNKVMYTIMHCDKVNALHLVASTVIEWLHGDVLVQRDAALELILSKVFIVNSYLSVCKMSATYEYWYEARILYR